MVKNFKGVKRTKTKDNFFLQKINKKWHFIKNFDL